MIIYLYFKVSYLSNWT